MDDEEKFESYLWGRCCFDEILTYLSKALTYLSKALKENKKSSYELCGFPWAFQVWGYEVIPKLGSQTAIHRGNERARILNWGSTHPNIFLSS